MPPEQRACDQEACTVAVDGVCLEGVALDDCPHHSIVTLDESHENDDAGREPEDQQVKPGVRLFSGEELDLEGVRQVMASSLTRMVVTVGDPDSGKTTLLAELWEQFQRGPFAGFLFAGSRTQPAFDRRCHLARIASGRSKPDTERTKRSDEVKWLHMAVRNSGLATPTQHLIFSDVSGEILRRMRDSTEEAARLSGFNRADHNLFLMNGAHLISIDERQRARTNAIMSLRSMLEAGQLGAHSLVDVAVSKWDLVVGKLEEANTTDFLKETKIEMTRRFEGSLGRLRFRHIAARPESGSGVSKAYGLSELFGSWVRDTLLVKPPVFSAPTPTSSDRESVCYRWRSLEDDG